MATKSKRAGAATPQPGGTSTPLMTGPNRPASPLSPTRHSRLVEKAELANLNDRLAAYIDRVRNLETENARLSIEVQTTRDTITREATNVKSMYENELSDARRLLDDTAREKAKLEIDIKRLWEENEEMKAKLDKKTKECSIAEGECVARGFIFCVVVAVFVFYFQNLTNLLLLYMCFRFFFHASCQFAFDNRHHRVGKFGRVVFCKSTI